MTLILLINSMLSGGAEKQLLLLATGLCRRGMRCSVYWFQDSPDHPRTVNLLAEAALAGVRLNRPSPGRKFDLGQVGHVRAMLRAEPGAIIWTWGARTELVGLIARLGLAGIRQIGSMRSAHPERIRKQRFLWRFLAWTHAAFVSNSYLNLSQIGSVAPAVLGKTSVIYNAVEPSCFAWPLPNTTRPDELTIVMLGNQNPFTKGYDLAVQVAVLLRQRGLPFRIRIGGTPLGMDLLEAQFQADGVSDTISLAGRIDDPAAFLRGGNVFLMLSRYEGTPNALLEAMALGLPSVCTRVGDVPVFATDRVHLRLVSYDPAEVVAALTELWDDWPQALAMGVAGRAMCRETFSEDLALQATELLLREVETTGVWGLAASSGR